MIQIGRTKIVYADSAAVQQQENQLKGLAGESTEHAADDLRRVAESLPTKTFHQSDLVILNTRGQAVHTAEENNAKNAKGGKGGGKGTAEAVTVLRMILLVCFRTRASDVHVEPKGEHVLVRARIDGTLVDIAKLNKDLGHRVMSLVKILCDIDISGRNIIQEGSFAARVPDRRVDYRVSFSPSVAGQKLVIRVLDEANAPRYLFELDLPERVFGEMDKSMRRDSGDDPRLRPDRQRQDGHALRDAPQHRRQRAETSSRSRTRSRSGWRGSRRCRSTRRPAAGSQTSCGRRCGRTRT